jgi:hypothetical protein
VAVTLVKALTGTRVSCANFVPTAAKMTRSFDVKSVKAQK